MGATAITTGCKGGKVVTGARVVSAGKVVGTGVVGGANSMSAGDCAAASALDETTPEQLEKVNEIKPIDTTTSALIVCVWLKLLFTISVTVVSIFHQVVDSPCIRYINQLYCSGSSNQIVSPYLTPPVSGKVWCGCVTNDGQAKSEPTSTSRFVNDCCGKSSSAP